MKNEIIYRDETNNDVTICRELCNRLMQYQASKTSSELYSEILSSMCFENRLLPSFESANEKQLIVAYDMDKPVGYVFSTAEIITEQNRNLRPKWATKISEDTQWLYPKWLKMPVKIGDLNNLYVLPEYRGQKIGQNLMDLAMIWLRQTYNVEWLFVDVANGNDVAAFYEHYGFVFSHKVLGGLIKAYCQKINRY